ncbi:MAG: hypothetical protein B6I25_08605 [Planctomycetales bacterium 4572_13]|nr:MAG: hypothetical protein B6I25_08605 [Planctomycetales bacterium 4572_13]
MLVISRDPARKEKDDFFLTTNLNMTAKEVLECYNDRWAIEDTFKNTKQLLGGQQPQTFKGKGPERAAGLSLWLYSVVWLWYLQQKSTELFHRAAVVQPENSPQLRRCDSVSASPTLARKNKIYVREFCRT